MPGERILRAAVALVIILCAREAEAFCRTTTCDPGDPKQNCVPQSDGCIRAGKPIFWGDRCVSFDVQERGSQLRDVSYNDALNAISKAFVTWLDADCGNATHPSIDLYNLGPVACNKQEYNQDAPNANIWLFRDDQWPYEDTAYTLALTTVTFNIESGEIYDADVEINSADNPLIIGSDRTKADLLSIVTHEAGHFLGLSHSNVTTATMFAQYHYGDISLRTLDPDDVAGICAIYPANRSAPTCTSAAPRHGFSSECSDDKQKTGCCTLAPGSRPLGTSALAALLAGATALIMRRRWRPNVIKPQLKLK